MYISMTNTSLAETTPQHKSQDTLVGLYWRLDPGQ